MKKSVLGISFCTIISSLIAQPVINSSDMFEAGLVYKFNPFNPDLLDHSGTGMPMNWDFSGLPNSISRYKEIYNSGTVLAGESFPDANIATIDTAGGTVFITNFYSNTNDAYSLHAIVTIDNFSPAPPMAGPLIYNPPLDIYRFPINSESQFSQEIAATQSLGSEAMIRSGLAETEVDGYGTLATPAGTFTDVIRLHTIENYTDSISDPADSYEVHTYTWISAETHCIPLLSKRIEYKNGSSVPNESAFYSTLLTTSIASFSSPQLVIYPNPATEFVNIVKPAGQRLALYDLAGSKVAEWTIPAGSNEFRISTSDFAAGVYILENSGERESARQKLVIR